MAAVPQALSESLREAIAAAAGGFIAAPLTLTVAPLAERWFGHATRWTLNEWLSYEHPLLRELARTAPGTFQHSVNVGVLADSAASAIGGDALLARLGGLYHDIGKMRAPAVLHRKPARAQSTRFAPAMGERTHPPRAHV